MKVLLIAMPFYNYEYKIKEAIESLGNHVDLVYDQEERNLLECICCKIKPSKSSAIDKQHQMSLLNKLSNDYDIVFTIVGRWLSPDFIDILRMKNKNAKFVLYLWDDVARVQNFNDVYKKYDKIFSFDNVDCMHYGFEFLPLFYRNEFEIRNVEKVYDLYGTLWIHSDRLNIVKKILDNYDNYKCYFYLCGLKSNYLKYKFSSEPYSKFVHYKSLDFYGNLDNMHRSKCVLDIQHPTQRGLTIRTIEAIGCGVKLITTNREVKNYDFYMPENICVIDRNNVEIPNVFFENPYVKLPEDVYRKYSLNNWVAKVLN